MKSYFKEWYEPDVKEELLTFYYEGSMCDMPLLTKIEQLMERAFEAGQDLGYENGCEEVWKMVSS